MAETNKRKLGPSVPAGHALGDFSNYQEASDLVDKLISGDFAAGKISIIGKDPVLVERVRSRLGYGRVAMSGAVTGLWLGILVALLAGSGVTTGADGQLEFIPQDFAAVAVVGAGIGMLVNILRFAFSKTKRGFLSSQMPIASRYQVIVPNEDAAQALKILSASTSE